MEDRGYTFREVAHCTMCGGERFRILGRRLDRSTGGQPRRKPGVSVSVARCRDCGLVFPQPIPIPATLEQHYDLPPEEYWSPDRLAGSGPDFAVEIATAFDLLDAGKPGAPTRTLTALDIGAGFGSTLRALANAGFDALGIEPSEPFRTAAIERFGVDPNRILPASIEGGADLDVLRGRIPPGGFDLISFGAVLEHLIDPGASIRTVLPWLAAKGIIHAEVPNAGWLMSKLFNAYFTLRGTDLVTHLSPMHPPYHVHEFTLQSFEQHGRSAGYRVVRHSRLVGDTFVRWPLDPIAKTLMKLTGTGLQLTVWLAPDQPVAQAMNGGPDDATSL